MRWILGLLVALLLKPPYSWQKAQYHTMHRKPQASSSERVVLYPEVLPDQKGILGGDQIRLRVDRFMLELSPNRAFAAPAHLASIHSQGHETLLRIHNDSAQDQSQHCYYVGNVSGDSKSHVSVSLCNGVMMGLIHTKEGDFSLEPHPRWSTQGGSTDDNQSHQRAHLLTRLTPSPSLSQNSTCGLDADPWQLPWRRRRKVKRKKKVEEEPGRKRKKRSVSHEHHLELMVVADSKMAAFHADNLRHYVLTLMSTVAFIYRHPSIGNDINLAVVKLVVLDEHEELDMIFPSAAKTLANFCKWQRQHNHYEDSHPLHHDIAILLTREDLCRLPKTCDTLGLAQTGMACDHYNSCAIVEDNGLSAAFTIAHELGHVLSFPHDDDRKCSRYQDEAQPLHVMARMLDYSSHPWSWSACSRHYVTNFFDSGSGDCLRDRPAQDLLRSVPELVAKPPGEVYNVDHQCALVYGRGSQICPYMPVCKRLWCTMTDIPYGGGCRTQHLPWADGTLCGHAKWCQQGECVRINAEKQRPVDGQWGQWSSFGQCSRSCGGGVQRSVRECHNPRPANGGRFCVGQRIRFQSCNTQECQDDLKDFREEQCSAFNGKNFSFAGVPANVKWVPQTSGIARAEACKLYCRASGSGSYFVLKDKVIDGTPCTPDTFDICVNGFCVSAGCDHELGSGKVLDKCGVCGGDNSTCKIIQGTFNHIEYGYNDVILIPAGASGIDIRQHGYQGTKDDNYLALKGHDQHYLLNGKFVVSMFPKSLLYNGVTLEYSGSDAVIERVNTTKALVRDLYVQRLCGSVNCGHEVLDLTIGIPTPDTNVRMYAHIGFRWHRLSDSVLSVGKLSPPDVHFQYMVSTARNQTGFKWDTTWSPCSRVCQGEQYKTAVCVKQGPSAQQVVSDSHCRAEEKPTKQARTCNINCQLRWQATPSGPCSSPCSKGTRPMNVQCVQQMLTEQRVANILQDEYCQHLGPRPSDMEDCQGECAQAQAGHWEYGQWTLCSKSCGPGGEQQRTAHCVTDQGLSTSEDHCDPELRMTSRPCSQGPCPQWQVANWTSCSVTCGTGERHRHYWCQLGAEKVASAFCDPMTLPPHKETCHHTCYTWKTTTWAECSVSCGGDGYQRRQVQCTSSEGHSLPDLLCEAFERPQDTRSCNRGPCPYAATTTPLTPAPPQMPNSLEPMPSDSFFLPRSNVEPTRTTSAPLPLWMTGHWSQCSASCGDGLRHRTVSCAYPGGLSALPDDHCDLSQRPAHLDPCRAISECPTAPLVGMWRTGEWGQCPVTCGQGKVTRYVACVRPDGTVLDDDHCNQESKPDTEKDCGMDCTRPPSTDQLEPLPDPLAIITHNSVQDGGAEWKTGQWGECSKTCGIGEQRRQVACYVLGLPSDDPYPCQSLPHRPEEWRSCNESPCPKWDLGPWGTCRCGALQNRTVSCLDHRGRSVEARQCDQFVQPPSSRQCPVDGCTMLRWYLGPWHTCCGGATEHRQVMCIDEREKSVPLEHCDGQPPESTRPCSRTDCLPAQWAAGEWSQCSGTCVNSSQSRKFLCLQASTPVDSSRCPESLPGPTTRLCRLKGCTYRWARSKWSKCSAVCGRGERHRAVTCQIKQTVVDDHMCATLQVPKSSKKCRAQACPYIWHPGPWTECSQSCGPGIQRRTVSCHRSNQFGWLDPTAIPAPSSVMPYCNVTDKPPTVRKCNYGNCQDQAYWRPGPWMPCSAKCGRGKQQRRVRCVDRTGNRTSKNHCQEILKPKARRRCSMAPCLATSCLEIQKRGSRSDGEYEVHVRGRKVRVYCARMNTSRPQDFLTLKSGESDNYSVVYFKSSGTENCQRHRPLDSCGCYEASHNEAGRTTFYRIAINMTTLQINPSDFTFSRTRGHRVPYGQSVECRSRCPQSRFSVSLLGTGLAVAPNTAWLSQGGRPAAKIQRLQGGQVIQGKCGGSCGPCLPSPGLRLDVAPP